MLEFSGNIRYTIAGLLESGEGIFEESSAGYAILLISVLIFPGLIVFTLIFVFSNSSESVFRKPFNPKFTNTIGAPISSSLSSHT